MLEMAIELYGLGDIRTLKLSQQRDKEIAEEQRKLYKAYMEGKNGLTICN